MGKLVVSLEGVVIKELRLTKEKVTLGRRPYNDIVIDNLAVSGEHAVLQVVGNDVFIEDVNSTNGTYVNGRPIRKQLITPNDTVEIGKYRIRYLSDEASGLPAGASGSAAASAGFAPTAPFSASEFSSLGTELPAPALIRVLNGGAAGRQVTLNKVVTTIGKPGVQVGSISRRSSGYVLAHIEGATRPTVNGVPVEAEPVPLRNGDIIELAGTRMQFVLD